MLFLVKTLIAALVIVAVGEINERSSVLSVCLLTVPSVLATAFMWTYFEHKDKVKLPINYC